MAREQRIDPGKLVPAAKPVSPFLNFQKGNIPNAAQPSPYFIFHLPTTYHLHTTHLLSINAAQASPYITYYLPTI